MASSAESTPTMSLNSWEKLARARRDFPKPKIAITVVERGLKKSPNNPYLLAWKIDLLLALDMTREALDRLNTMSAWSVVTDTRYLEYLYTFSAEAIRRSNLHHNSIGSIGAQPLIPWQAAAQAVHCKADRLTIWNALFAVSIREDCWDDARFVCSFILPKICSS